MMKFVGIMSKTTFVYCMCRRLEHRACRTHSRLYSRTCAPPFAVAYATLIVLKAVERPRALQAWTAPFQSTWAALTKARLRL